MPAQIMVQAQSQSSTARREVLPVPPDNVEHQKTIWHAGTAERRACRKNKQRDYV
jgi:hypothetical protein